MYIIYVGCLLKQGHSRTSEWLSLSINPQILFIVTFTGRQISERLLTNSRYILDEKSNLPQICLLQICCKYEICKALQPVQRWQWPNLHKNGQIRPSPHLHCVQSCPKLILATYLHKANLMQIRFFVLYMMQRRRKIRDLNSHLGRAWRAIQKLENASSNQARGDEFLFVLCSVSQMNMNLVFAS